MHQHFFNTDGHLCNTVENCGCVPQQQENGIHLHCAGKNTNELEAMQTFKLQGNRAAISPRLHEQEESVSLAHALKKWSHLWATLLY